MNSVWIFLILQMLHAACFPMFTDLLGTKFGYDFTQQGVPNIGKVIVWQMWENSKTFQPQIYERNIPKFDSDKTYLIVSQSQPGQICIYYWVGSTAPLVAKKRAAKYALLHYLMFKNHHNFKIEVSLYREEEFIESRSFQNTVNFSYSIDGMEWPRIHQYYHDLQLPYKSPNLYLVRGTYHTARVKVVPIGTQWFVNDACLILETGYIVEKLSPVTKFCGPTVSSNTHSLAMCVAIVIGTMYIIDINAQPYQHVPSIKAFVEALENSDYYRPHEVDNSGDYLKVAETFVADRDRNVTFQSIFEDKMTRTDPKPKIFFSQYYHNYEIFEHPGSYLLDSASVAGLFLQIHPNICSKGKLMAIKMAEEYLHNTYSLASKPTHMRITEIYDNNGIMPVNLTINLSNFPTFRELEGIVNDINDNHE